MATWLGAASAASRSGSRTAIRMKVTAMGTDIAGLLREALHRPAVIHRPGCAEGDLLDRLMRDDSFMECSCGGTGQFHDAIRESEAAQEARTATEGLAYEARQWHDAIQRGDFGPSTCACNRMAGSRCSLAARLAAFEKEGTR